MNHEHEHLVEITVILTDAQAWQFAQFLKRACFSDYRSHATSEAYRMIDAGEHIRRALANKATHRDTPPQQGRFNRPSLSGLAALAASVLRFPANRRSALACARCTRDTAIYAEKHTSGFVTIRDNCTRENPRLSDDGVRGNPPLHYDVASDAGVGAKSEAF